MSPLPLDSLEIKNFRCFEHLVIEKLGRVNLIVGKNGVGKTSLLEAFNLYATQAPPHQLFLTLLGRAAVYPKPPDNILTFEILGSLFYEQKTTVGTIIEIGTRRNENSRISIQTIYCIDDPHNELRQKEVGPDIVAQINNVNIGLKITYGRRGRIFKLPLSTNPAQHGILLANYPVNNCEFIHAEGMNPAVMSIYWDQLLLEGQEAQATDILKIIDPGIERIYMIVNSDIPFGRIPYVKTRKLEKPIQLYSHGDGIRRLFGFALALMKSRNSYLLIDEFENGLHHDIQATVWHQIFRLAKESNIQVFATTHSWDCVEAFQEAAAEDQNEEAMLIRLQRKRDSMGIEAVSYDERSMDVVTRQGIEVR